MEHNELYHHGIKGMRWGVRRYQNKDGSLTAKGRQRYNEEAEKLKAKEKELNTRARTQAKLDKLDAKRKELAAREKALKEAERPEIVKKFLEKRQQKAGAKGPVETKGGEKRSIKDLSDKELNDLVLRMRNEKEYRNLYNDLNPKKVSKGKEFVKSIFTDSVIPGMKEGLKSAIRTASTDAFGSAFTKTMEKDAAKVKKAADTAQQKTKQKEKAKAETKSDEPEYFTGTVSGSGTSKKASAGRSWTQKDTVIDADWWEVSPSRAPSTSVSLGQSYVAGLLPERRT